jgi:hypothetical protein
VLRIDRDHALQAVALLRRLLHDPGHPELAGFVVRISVQRLSQEDIGAGTVAGIEGGNPLRDEDLNGGEGRGRVPWYTEIYVL